MKKVIRKSLSLLTALSVIISIFAFGTVAHAASYFTYGEAGSGGKLQYIIKSSTTAYVFDVVSGGMPSNGIVTVPQVANGYTIVGIDDSAFSNQDSLHGITLPDTITYIGDRAFYNCESLVDITLPYYTTSIGQSAFLRTGITSIKIPFGVVSIGEYAFRYCDSLKKVYIPDTVTSIGRNCFCDDESLTDIYYSSTQSAWNLISIDSHNDSLDQATINYNSYRHTNHKYLTEVRKAPTCTASGTYYYYCDKCSYGYTSAVSATGHKFDEWRFTYVPTCTENGVQRRDCQICDTFETQTVYSSGHSYSSWTYTITPSCTEGGSQRRTCVISGCNETQTRDVSAFGHEWKNDYTIDIAATCTEDGSKSIHCIRCETKSNVTEIKANGHNFSDWSVATEATCTSTGEERRECTECEVLETRETSALGHVWENEYTVDLAPTCTEEGSKSIYCSVCGAFSDTTLIPALGHDWENDYITDEEAICTEDGSKSIHCKRCTEKKDVTAVPATGHSYDEWYVAKEATATANGEKRRVCGECDAYETEIIPAFGSENSALYLKITNPVSTIGYGDIVSLSVETNADYPCYLNWKSSKPSVLKVNDGGAVEAVDEGTATISVTLYDADGNAVRNEDGSVVSDSIEINCTMTIWQKIIRAILSFFELIAGIFK